MLLGPAQNHVGAPVVENRTVQGPQLQLGDEANSIIADGGDLGTLPSQVTSVGDLPTSSVSAVQLVPETMCLRLCANAPRYPRISDDH